MPATWTLNQPIYWNAWNAGTGGGGYYYNYNQPREDAQTMTAVAEAPPRGLVYTTDPERLPVGTIVAFRTRREEYRAEDRFRLGRVIGVHWGRAAVRAVPLDGPDPTEFTRTGADANGFIPLWPSLADIPGGLPVYHAGTGDRCYVNVVAGEVGMACDQQENIRWEVENAMVERWAAEYQPARAEVVPAEIVPAAAEPVALPVGTVVAYHWHTDMDGRYRVGVVADDHGNRRGVRRFGTEGGWVYLEADRFRGLFRTMDDMPAEFTARDRTDGVMPQFRADDPGGYALFTITRHVRDTWHKAYQETLDAPATPVEPAPEAPVVRYTLEQLSPRDQERCKTWEQINANTWPGAADTLRVLNLPDLDRDVAAGPRQTVHVRAVLEFTRPFTRGLAAGTHAGRLNNAADPAGQVMYLHDALTDRGNFVGDRTQEITAEVVEHAPTHPFLSSNGTARLDPVTAR